MFCVKRKSIEKDAKKRAKRPFLYLIGVFFLVGAISAIQAQRVISKQARNIKDWIRMCKSTEENVEAGKARQQELAEEVSALGAELSQAWEQLASKDFILTEKEADLANKEKELAVRAAKIT